jgi:hypothetical protein
LRKQIGGRLRGKEVLLDKRARLERDVPWHAGESRASDTSAR